MNKQEEILGWYHSHPNYGPWLSGIDVNTQKSMQTMGPMLAIVIDPIRSEISGKVDIGAFRTCKPDGFLKQSQDQSIPEEKIKDFGLHHDQYYKLKIEYFMNKKDFEIIEYCWTKFWKTILESDSLIQNKADFSKTLVDLANKAKKAKHFVLNLGTLVGKKGDGEEAEQRIKEFTKFSMELSQAVHQDCMKILAFN